MLLLANAFLTLSHTYELRLIDTFVDRKKKKNNKSEADMYLKCIKIFVKSKFIKSPSIDEFKSLKSIYLMSYIYVLNLFSTKLKCQN